VLHDLSSIHFDGAHCSLGKIGYSRVGKKNELRDDQFTLLRSISTLLGDCS
jgi:hypothetical protein